MEFSLVIAFLVLLGLHFRLVYQFHELARSSHKLLEQVERWQESAIKLAKRQNASDAKAEVTRNALVELSEKITQAIARRAK